MWVKGVQWPWTMVFGKSVTEMYELGNLCEFCDDHYYHTNSIKKGTAKHYDCWLIVLNIFPLKINPYMSTFIHIDIAEVYHTKISVSSISCLCCIKDKRYCFNWFLIFFLFSLAFHILYILVSDMCISCQRYISWLAQYNSWGHS